MIQLELPVTSKSVTLIDHIYTSRPEEVMQVRVSTYCPGDHYPVNCSVKYGKSNKSEPRVNKHTVIRYRNFKNFDEELFLRDLKNQNFNLVLQITDPDLALDSWYEIYTLNKHAPLISKRVKKNKQPKWHKKEFADLRRQRDYQGRIQDFKLGGGGGGGGGGAHFKFFWGISCEKSPFYANKSYLFQF